jgi:murein L,D-transpeptidase YcbB/YkuD
MQANHSACPTREEPRKGKQPGAMRSRMSKRAVITLAVIIGMWLGGWERLHAAVERSLSSQVSEQMWERLLTAGTPAVLRVAGDSLRSGNLLLQFYTRRLYWPAWSNDAGLLPQIDTLLKALQEVETEGLQAPDYHLARLESLCTELQLQSQAAPLSAAALADLDLLLTDALLTYGSHLLYGRYGRAAPRLPNVLFDTSPENIDVVDVLQQGLEANRLAEALHSLLPRHPDYARLRQALARYRQTPGAEAQVQQIALNMERWRWLPQDLGQRYILVDVPAYTLHVVEQDQSVMSMRVVVGKPSWPTPVLSATMSYVVLNPDWRVPPNIAARELVPILRANPGYLAQNNMRMSDGAREVDPRSVDWSQVSTKNFPYRLRQAPGPKNPLGTIKFMFPNRFQVYLHDTPSRTLFAKPTRAFSHGCIRVEKPMDLAEYVLRGVLSREHIAAGLGRRTSRTVPLAEPLPTYLVYRTVLVKNDGTMQFRPDIYGYDNLREGMPPKKSAKSS